MHLFGWVFAVILMLAGVAGTILPGLPGTLLVFIGLCLAAWLGLVLGTLARLALAFLMIEIFFLAYLWPS